MTSVRLAILAAILAMAHGDAAAQAVASKDEVLAHVEAAFDAIDSIEVHYSRPGRDGGGHEIVAQLAFLGGLHMMVDGGHGVPGAPWQDSYARSRSYVVGDVFEVEWPNKLAWERIPLEHGVRIQRFEAQAWIKASGYWPDGARIAEPAAYGVPFGLRTALRNDDYHIEPECERRHGVTCVVLTDGRRDRLWLDPERGYAICGRRIEQDDRPALELRVHEFELTAIGVHLPVAFEVQVFRDADGRAYDPPVVTTTTVHATRVNDLDPTDYCLTPRPGALRFDRWNADGFEQTVPGGLHFLHREARRQRAAMHAPQPAASGWLPLGWPQFGAALAILMALAWLLPGWLVRERGRRSSLPSLARARS